MSNTEAICYPITQSVLVVDDDQDVLDLLRGGLEEMGFRVFAVSDGRTALSTLQETTIDLILSDVMMPTMDGFDLVREVKKQADSSAIPFLFFSGRNELEDRVKGLELGASDFIAKPFDLHEVCLRVRSLLAQQSHKTAQQERIIQGAVNLFKLGIIVLARDGQVRLMNNTAREIIEDKDGLFLKNNKLQGKRPTDTQQINELIQSALNFDGNIQTVHLNRGALKRDLSLIAIPLDRTQTVGSKEPLLIVNDPEKIHMAPVELLVEAYQFTQAEARVASLLAQGYSVAEICDELNVTRNTVSTHLKKLYLKTDTQGQSDLTRLILSGFPQLKLD